MPLVGMAVRADVRQLLVSLGVSHILDDYYDAAAVFAALDGAAAPEPRPVP